MTFIDDRINNYFTSFHWFFIVWWDRRTPSVLCREPFPLHTQKKLLLYIICITAVAQKDEYPIYSKFFYFELPVFIKINQSLTENLLHNKSSCILGKGSHVEGPTFHCTSRFLAAGCSGILSLLVASIKTLHVVSASVSQLRNLSRSRENCCRSFRAASKAASLSKALEWHMAELQQ